MHLLDGEDNSMLSVPFRTSDPHTSYWQSGEICQVVATGAFTLLGSNFWFALTGGCSPHFFCPVVLPPRCLLDVSRLLALTLRPSAPTGFLDTREAGTCAGSRAWSSFFLLDKYPVIQAVFVNYLFMRC